MLHLWLLKYNSQSGANGRGMLVRNMKASFLGWHFCGHGIGFTRDATWKSDSSSSGSAVLGSNGISWWFLVLLSLGRSMVSGFSSV